MSKQYIGGIITGILMAFSMLLGFLLARADTDVFAQRATPTPPFTATVIPTSTFPPSSPLPTLTPSQTLLPPPTFEPPTVTPQPTQPPTITATSTLRVNVAVPQGLRGYPSPTVASSTVCEKREDWKLRYTVQPGDALSTIATRYGTFVDELVEGNCLKDANTIISGQVLHVPGDAQPVVPQYVCTEWEALTPFNGAYTIEGDQDLSFVWRGPVADRYLVRVVMPSGNVWEQLVDKQQNLEVYLPEVLPEEGNHTWYVYPLGLDFLQIPCQEGGPWNFHKFQSPALTWTPTATPTITNTPQTWQQTATAQAS